MCSYNIENSIKWIWLIVILSLRFGRHHGVGGQLSVAYVVSCVVVNYVMGILDSSWGIIKSCYKMWIVRQTEKKANPRLCSYRMLVIRTH
jgi:hypothetical protein